LRKLQGGSFEYIAKVESILIEIDKESFQINSDSRVELIFLIKELLKENTKLEAKKNLKSRIQQVLSEDERNEFNK